MKITNVRPSDAHFDAYRVIISRRALINEFANFIMTISDGEISAWSQVEHVSLSRRVNLFMGSSTTDP